MQLVAGRAWRDTVSAVRIVKFSGSDAVLQHVGQLRGLRLREVAGDLGRAAGMAPVISGAETTFPSRTIATVASQ